MTSMRRYFDSPFFVSSGEAQCLDGSDESEDVCPKQQVRLQRDLPGRPAAVEVKPKGSERPFLSVINLPFGDREANVRHEFLVNSASYESV